MISASPAWPRRLGHGPLLVLLLALALTGCKSMGSERALARFGGGSESGGSERVAEAAADEAPPAAVADASSAPAQTAALPAPESASPDEAPAEVDARPARLMGLAPDALDAELGPPEMVRREAPAEVWQYRTRACVLDVYLYPAGADGGGPEVLHLEARDAVSAEPADAGDCLATLLRRELARGTEG